MTHTNHYRSFAERLPMINFTITDDKNEASHTHGTTSINIATHVYTSRF